MDALTDARSTSEHINSERHSVGSVSDQSDLRQKHDVDAMIISAVASIVRSYIEASKTTSISVIRSAIHEFGVTFSQIIPSTERSSPHFPEVDDDFVICLECGRRMKTLARHLSGSHRLSVEEYRAKWRLPAHHPMISANYARRRAEIARRASNLPVTRRGKGETGTAVSKTTHSG